MGYENEKASFNQYSELLDYCQKNVVAKLKEMIVVSDDHHEQIKKEVLPFQYEPKDFEGDLPILSFDGGMGSLFKDTEKEVCLIKVSGACPPEFEHFFDPSDFKNVIFHTYVGELRHSDHEKQESIVKSEIERLCEVPIFNSMLSFFEVDKDLFQESFIKLVNQWKDKSAIKDSFREFLEWALVIDFIQNYSKKSNNKIPYLIIKDGNIGSNPKAVSSLISNKIKELLEGDNKNCPVPFIVGAVKSSRYVGEESVLGHVVYHISKNLPSHSFFKLPARFEIRGDKDAKDKPFRRYFLTLFGGEKIYEIQVPNKLRKDKELLFKALDIVSSQVTFMYGGSIATNSYAHIKASLAEAEIRMLESNLEMKIREELENGK